MDETAPLWPIVLSIATGAFAAGIALGSWFTQRRLLHFQALTALLKDWRSPEMLAALQRLWSFYHQHTSRASLSVNR